MDREKDFWASMCTIPFIALIAMASGIVAAIASAFSGIGIILALYNTQGGMEKVVIAYLVWAFIGVFLVLTTQSILLAYLSGAFYSLYLIQRISSARNSQKKGSD